MKKIIILALAMTMCNVSCARANEPENPNETTAIVVTVSDRSFEATVDNSATGNAFLALLPMTLSMDELNSNEKYCYLSTNLPTNTYSPGTIYAGDILLYGNSCVVLFYETFSSGYSYSRIGRVTNPTDLADVLGSGNVSVTFALATTTSVQNTPTDQLSGAKFNLQGQRVSDDYRGIVIQNGQKRIQ